MQTALLFPGQGSQRVGMGRDLALAHEVARRTYEEADDTLGFALSKLCWEGPEDELVLTKHTQPAILTTSIAVFRALLEKGLTFDVVAGHSLGEWTALVAAGAISLRDAVKLTHLRGTFMQEAVPVGQGAMAAIMGLDLDKTRALCEQASAPGEPCEPANMNGGGQIVISGHAAAIERAMAAAKPAGARLAKKLPVSAPFHCSLMKPAQDRLAVDLAALPFQNPSIPVVCNVDAAPVTDATASRDALVRQVTGSVKWQQSIQLLIARGVERFVEVGPGKVLCGLMRQIDRSKPCSNVGDAASLQKTLEQLS